MSHMDFQSLVEVMIHPEEPFHNSIAGTRTQQQPPRRWKHDSTHLTSLHFFQNREVYRSTEEMYRSSSGTAQGHSRDE
jgi:hypothetical protein